MKKRFLSILLVMVIAAAALTGCGGGKQNAESTSGTDPSDEQPTSGGSVKVGMTQDLVSLDPHSISDAGTRNVVFNIYEGLVKPTADGDLIPAVASDYKISEDGMTYTFTLRDGIKFHNGDSVTAKDIVYSLKRYAEIQGESSAFSVVEKIEAVDDKTVEISLKEKNTEFLPQLTVAIIPESITDIAKEPVGTGPFKFESYTPGQKLILVKFDDYWQPGKPYLDSVEFKIIANMETAYTQLQSGSIDILNYLTIDQVESLSKDKFNVVTGSMNLIHALYLNNDYEPLRDVRVRQAICYAVNRDSINEFLFGGESTIIGAPMPKKIARYYNADVADAYPYDPAKAKELLKQAGYEDGFELVIQVPSSYSQHVATAQIIVEDLKAVGIKASIKQIEWSSWLDDVYKGRKYQATVTGVDGTLAPGSWFARYRSDAGKNFINYKSDKFDETYDKALAAPDNEEKDALYKELQQILSDDAASVYIEDPADFVGTTKRVRGYVFYPTAAWDMSCVYVTE
ncbi:MAG: ABC transporter substrate-binding protein [Lachnospiraceae bacterium]|nr:ABC transporter substrate-binding protein [Lachnospiraceae bacterium]